MIIIGIAGSEQESGLINMLRNIFNKAKKKISIVETYDFHLSTEAHIAFQQYLDELRKNKIDVAIIKIMREKLHTDLYKHISFNIIVYNEISRDDESSVKDEWIIYGKNIFKAMGKKDMAIVNIDENTALQVLTGSKMCVITYGLSSKATITASSIEEDADFSTFIYCLQRTITTVENDSIEPQEFPVKVISSKNIYDTLAAVTTALVCRIEVSVIRQLIL